MMLGRDFVCVDLETTGANAATERITEIGIVEVSGAEVSGEWSALVNPQRPIPPSIAAITGISDAMVGTAPTFRELAHDVERRLAGRLFVAHNARFDYGFLQREFQRAGVEFRADVLCTVKLSRRLWPAEHSHSLDAIIARHDLDCSARHRALGDAQALWQFLRRVGATFPAERIAAEVTELLRRPALPEQLAPGVLESLPESAGIYRLYGEDGTVLYVGRAGNLRARVAAHFSGAQGAGRDARLAQQVHDLDWIETAGELGALLAQARLIRELAPVHNRKPRDGVGAWTLRLAAAAPDYPVDIVECDDPGTLYSGECFGMFRSRRDAANALRGLAAQHRLCLRRLGLDATGAAEGACSAHASGRCAGCCVDAEPIARHDARLHMALAPLRVKPWPFPGRIGIREHDPVTGSSALHVVDRWCYLGSAGGEDELHDLLEARHEPCFDADSYRILSRYLAQAGSSVLVDLA